MKRKLIGIATALAIFLMAVPLIHAETVASGNCGAYNSESGEYADNVTWTLSDNGTLRISGAGAMYSVANKPWQKYISDIKSVTINDGVTTISEYAFSGCYNLMSVSLLSKSLTEIGNSAFDSCHISGISFPSGLKKIGERAFSANQFASTVNIPAGVEEIGAGAFSSFYAFTLAVDEANEKYKSVDGVIFNKDMTELVAYSGAKLNTSDGIYTVPDTVTSIVDKAFYNNPKGLNGVILPEGLEKIGESAFAHANLSNSLFIPENVSVIGTDAFYSLNNGKGIEVDENNQYYSSEDNALFNKDKTSLITYKGDALMYSVPDSVSSIEANAFSNMNKIQMIYVPEGVTNIGETAFEACTSLNYISLPESLDTLGANAFVSNHKLKNIYYAGSAEKWQTIAVNQYGLGADVVKTDTSGIPTKILDTSTVSSDSNTYSFDIDMITPQGGELVAVLYNGSEISAVKNILVEAGTTKTNVSITCDGADSARIFLWDSLNELKPQCNVKEISNIESSAQ